MKWCREYINKNYKWERLLQRIELMEISVDENPNIIFDYATGLISTVTKTILKDYEQELNGNEGLSKLLKDSLKLHIERYEEIGELEKESIKKIINGLCSVVSSIGELRNKLGYIAHGKDLFSKDSLPLLSKTVLKSTDIVVGFLLQIELELETKRNKKYLDYNENQEFNEQYDENYENIEFGTISLVPSEVLFKVDIEAYKTELNLYKSGEFLN